MATVQSKTSAKIDALLDDHVVSGRLSNNQVILSTVGGMDLVVGIVSRDFTLEERGAVGDGVTDDSNAIEATIALMRPGDRLVPLSNKIYAHSRIIDLNIAGIQVIGGTFKALNSAQCAMYLTSPGVVVAYTTKIVPESARTNTQPSHSFVMRGAGQTLHHVTADGAGGCGIFVFGATDYLIDSPLVKNTQADGIHNTYGSTRGTIRSPRIYNTGDDYLAFVSYAGDPAPVTNVRAIDVYADCAGQTNGRGISVVGGEDIEVENYKIIDSWGASIYINIETAYPSRAIQRIRFKRGEIIRPNRGWGVGPNHGAILISNQGPTYAADDIQIQDVTVKDSGDSMVAVGRIIAFQKESTGTLTNVYVDDVKVRGTMCANMLSNPPGLVNAVGTIDQGRASSAPTTAKTTSGAKYFDTTLNQMGYFNGTVWVYYGQSSDPGFKVLTGNVSASDNSSYPIDDLSIPVGQNATYVVEGLVFYEASVAGDIKVYWLGPSGANFQWGGMGLSAAANAGSTLGDFNSLHVDGFVSTIAFGGAGIGTKQHIILRGILTTFSVTGNLQLGFGQQTTDAGNATVVKAKSWIRATRVA